ncbi:hypothetical protein JTE90_027383 [Oedothorax gibbosus]|uniref:Uncharacterized protein n=1 Tax=Oedothorax gibbosus TaxID=931172 RepID=A0AAV6W2R2_9ARAC|nr:hypothetical protein JTE90_027383 [Oedothorax gibbosus]
MFSSDDTPPSKGCLEYTQQRYLSSPIKKNSSFSTTLISFVTILHSIKDALPDADDTPVKCLMLSPAQTHFPRYRFPFKRFFISNDEWVAAALAEAAVTQAVRCKAEDLWSVVSSLLRTVSS